ncbi:MAG: hypothetical protein P8M36_03995 [Gammaproteobacteria bacterium]|nr:hypothetical protein [Gammaproteobacteria bacterium]
MNRRDFLTLRTKGQQRVIELSCERLYMLYADANAGIGRWKVSEAIGKNQQAWGGEPPIQINSQTVPELLDTLNQELAKADILVLLEKQWLDSEGFGAEVEVCIQAFCDRGGIVESR